MTGRVVRLVPRAAPTSHLVGSRASRDEEPDLSPAEQGAHRVRCYAAAAIASGASEVEVMDAVREGIRAGLAMLVRE